MSNANGSNGPHQGTPAVAPPTAVPYHQPQPCLDHRYMAAAVGGFMGPRVHHPKHQSPPSGVPMGMHLPQHSSATSPGYFPPGGPPVVNSQYPNAFLFNCYHPGVANGWTGVPLISTAKRRPPRKSYKAGGPAMDVKDLNGGNSMSKLALHAHGAPLILTGASQGGCNGNAGPRYAVAPGRQAPPPMRYRNKSNQNAQRVQMQQQQQQQPPQLQLNGGQPRVAESLSRHCDRGFQFASDENSSNFSGSCSSSTTSSSSPSGGGGGVGVLPVEACLPRIIKPRKRRKKERKPGSGGCGSGEGGDFREEANGQDLLSKTSEEDFEDDEVLVSDFTTSCSCRLCDPNSHIWSFPLRRVCSRESDSFLADPDRGHDLERQESVKDVGVIGGNRLKQQRNEWRGSSSVCDNKSVLHGDSHERFLDRRIVPELFSGGWPEDEHLNAKSDEDSVDSFPCANVFGMVAPSSRGVALDNEEELLIENLANLLNVSGGGSGEKNEFPTHLPEHCERNSDSSGVSSASDCGSVFGECYSPLVNLGSPPSMAFNFPLNPGQLPLGGYNMSSGLFTTPLPSRETRTVGELLLTSAPTLDEQQQQQQQQQRAMNCLDMEWYRAATTNRRLLMPFSNN